MGLLIEGLVAGIFWYLNRELKSHVIEESLFTIFASIA